LINHKYLTDKLANIGLGGIAILACHTKLTWRLGGLRSTQSAEIIQDIVTAYPKLLSKIHEELLSMQTNIKEL